MAQSVNSPDPFDPTNLRLSEEEIRRWQEARQSTIRNSKQPQKPKQLWCKFDYENQLGLARIFRVPVIALQAELYRLWFKLPNNEKYRPIELGNSVFRKLGFSHHDKFRALKHLEEMGWVKIANRNGQTPSVVVFHF